MYTYILSVAIALKDALPLAAAFGGIALFFINKETVTILGEQYRSKWVVALLVFLPLIVVMMATSITQELDHKYDVEIVKEKLRGKLSGEVIGFTIDDLLDSFPRDEIGSIDEALREMARSSEIQNRTFHDGTLDSYPRKKFSVGFIARGPNVK